MIRYVCENPYCLNTFLSPDLERIKKCDQCNKHLIYFGIPEKHLLNTYPPIGETIEDLKSKYIEVTKKSSTLGITDDEFRIIGRIMRKLTFDERKKILEENGLWNEHIIYKFVKKKDGLWKMVIDKRKMNYEKKKSEKCKKKQISQPLKLCVGYADT